MNQVLFAWLMLLASIVAEIVGTLALRYSQGLSKWGPALLCGGCYLLAVWLMGIALRRLDMGLTYAVWAAGGTAGTALLGMLVFSEPYNAARMLGLGLIVSGVVLLNLQGSH